MAQKSIAVIGQGFVGGSLTTVFAERGFKVFTYDKAGKIATLGSYPVSRGGGNFPAENVTELVNAVEAKDGFSKVYFVCLPTPMYEDGSADLSIVESVLKELASLPGERIAVVKSTVPPGSVEMWNKKFASTGLRVIFNPEFLTEANAVDDMRNQNRIILGGPRPYINTVKQVFQSAFPNVTLIKTSSTTAEMVKYFTNVHLAARVVLSCELWQICEKLDAQGLNIDYDKVKEYANYDKRLGGSHMSVPGFDGVPGARGHCFPKDLNALIAVAKSIGVTPSVMSGVWEKNLEVVPPDHRDWEKMVGRAISKKG
jgi:UDPglucose 6-dehydrogenase